tara:strand:+ start:588 stop:950 length:363 start_codon:yes stop_codon:yes gene_type:complete
MSSLNVVRCVYTSHAKKRMKQRKIKKRIVNTLVKNLSTKILEIKDDKMIIGDKSLTVVTSFPTSQKILVITAYWKKKHEEKYEKQDRRNRRSSHGRSCATAKRIFRNLSGYSFEEWVDFR